MRAAAGGTGRKKALLTSIVLPATVGFTATIGLPMLILLLCQSPLNV